MERDAWMLDLDLDQIDRIHVASYAEGHQIIGEPDGAGAHTRADFEYGKRAELGEQHRVHGKIEDVLHERCTAPTHERGSALAGQQYVDAELSAEPRMIMDPRPLALGEFHQASLLPAIKEETQSHEVPLQGLALRGGAQSLLAYAVLPRATRIKAHQAGDDACKPAVEDIGKTA